MIGYSLQIALRELRRHGVLSALIVATIGVGIGTFMTAITMHRLLSANPLPERGHRLFYVQLDAEPLSGRAEGDEPPEQMTRLDAERLLRDARGERQALMTAGRVSLRPDTPGAHSFLSNARFTSADFFPMFRPPFRYGAGWNAGQDADNARVVVLSKPLNDRLFGGRDSVGRSLSLQGHAFRVVGVLDDWRPAPKFYDLTGDDFASPEKIFLPFSTSRDLGLAINGNIACWGDVDDDDPTSLLAPCAWIQYWVELGSGQDVERYRAYLDNYSSQQHAAGAFARRPNARLRDIPQWLAHNRVVPDDVRLQAWLAVGFLLICMINAAGLQAARFLRRSDEIGLRRALGATRRQILGHVLVDVGTLGIAGGLFGTVATAIGLALVRQQPVRYAELASLDATTLIATLCVSVLVSGLAGLLPAWRATTGIPALQLRS